MNTKLPACPLALTVEPAFSCTRFDRMHFMDTLTGGIIHSCGGGRNHRLLCSSHSYEHSLSFEVTGVALSWPFSHSTSILATFLIAVTKPPTSSNFREKMFIMACSSRGHRLSWQRTGQGGRGSSSRSQVATLHPQLGSREGTGSGARLQNLKARPH